jgi:hypothetical protein
VYLGFKNGLPVYTGITVDIASRACKHADRFEFLLPITSSKFPKDYARAVEQVLIERNPQFQNQINSISQSREWYSEARAWGETFLKNFGF